MTASQDVVLSEAKDLLFFGGAGRWLVLQRLASLIVSVVWVNPTEGMDHAVFKIRVCQLAGPD